MSTSSTILNNPIAYLYPPLSSKITRPDNYNETNHLLTKTLIERIIYAQKRKMNLTNEEKQALTNYLSNSSLITKLKEDKSNNPKNDIDIQATCKACIDIIQLKKLEKGENVYNLHDPGDLRFFLLEGHLSSLKPTPIPNCPMTIDNYLIYLINLKHADEVNLLTLVLQQNYEIFPVTTEEGLQLYINYYIKSIIDNKFQTTAINVPILKKFLSKYHKSLEDYNLNEEQVIVKYKECKASNNWYHTWLEFIYKSFRPSKKEALFIDENPLLEKVDLLTIHNITCITYASDIQYYRGDFFGHYAYDTNEKRDVGMRAEEESFIGFLTSDQYLQLIFPKMKEFKLKATNFLYETYFFKTITPTAFEKYYLHLFTFHEKNPNCILYHQGTPVDDILFIMKGEVRISLSCSIADMHNILKFSLDTIEELDPNGISANTLAEMKKKSLDDPNLIKLQSTIGNIGRFAQEMKLKTTFKLFSLKEKDILGIEEAFLNSNHFTTCEVGKDPIQYYSINIKSLKKIFASEYECVEPYTYLAIKKITSLLTRINQIKQNSVVISLSKIQIDNKKANANQPHQLKSYCHTNSIPLHVDFNKKGKPKKLIQSFISNNFSHQSRFLPLIKSPRDMTINSDCIEHTETKIESNLHLSPMTTINAHINTKSRDIPSNHHIKIISRAKKSSSTPSIEVKPSTKNFSVDLLKKQAMLLKSTDTYQNFSTGDEYSDQIKVSVLKLQSSQSEIMPFIPINIIPSHLNSNITERLKAFQIKQKELHLMTQDERVGGIERAMADNLLNDGTNMIAEKVKSFYYLKKMKGYSNLGKGKSSLQKNNTMTKLLSSNSVYNIY